MKAVQPKAAEPASGAKSSFFQKGGEASLNNETPFFTKSNAPVQAKLTVGQPDDQFEMEADSMADKVVQRLAEPDSIQTKPLTPAPTFTPFIQEKCASSEKEDKLQQKEEEKEHEPTPDLMTKSAMGEAPPPPPAGDDDKDKEPVVQRKCVDCEKEEALQKKEETGDKEKDEPVQRKCASCEKEEALQKKGDPSEASPGLEKKLSSTKGSGAPLSEGVRSNMETAMGASFSNVRVHTDSNAAGMNKQLRAQAFTHGSDIYFNSGKYNPGNKTGQHLLAHELTHTVQQGHSKTADVHARMIRMKRETIQLQADLAMHADQLMAKRETPNIQTGILGTITDFALGAVGDLADLLGIELPSSPMEALRMIVEAAEAHPTIVSTVPGLSSVIMALKAVLVLVDLIQEVIDHKEEILQAVKDFLNEKIAGAPDLILTIMSGITGIEKNHLFIIFNYYFPAALHSLATTDWWEVLKTVAWEQLWPFEGITSVVESDPNNRTGLGRDLGDLFDHVSNAVSELSGLHISRAADEVLLVQRAVNVIAGRFYGWVALIIIAAEGIMGGIAGAAAGGVGAIPGIAAGLGAGVATADTIGYVLLGASAATEMLILLKSVASLNPVHEALADPEKAEENHNYYTQITRTVISLGIMGALAIVAWLAGKAAGAIMSKLYELLPKNVQQLMDEFISAYTARRAALLGGGATPDPNPNGGGSSGNGNSGSGSTGGNGSSGNPPQLRVIQGGGGSGGSTGAGGTSGGGGGTRGNLALADPVPFPEIDPRIDPAIVPNPDPRYPPYLQPVPTPVAPPAPTAGTTPATGATTGTTPGTGIGTGIGVAIAQQQGKGKKPGGNLLYQWQTPYVYQSRNGRINYTGARRSGVRYRPEGHHPWPKTLGGLDSQTLITIIVTIHQEEIHFGRSPVNSPVVAAIGSIYNYLTIAINAHPDFGIAGANVLQGRRLTHPGGPGSGNELMIQAMGAGTPNAVRLAAFVRDSLTAYYGIFSAYSSPVIPYTAYRQGLDESYNDII